MSESTEEAACPEIESSKTLALHELSVVQTQECENLDIRTGASEITSTTVPQGMAFKVPALKVKLPLKEFSEEKDTGIEEKTPDVCKEVNKSTETSDVKRHKAKISHLSPTELLKQSEIPVPYKIPSWGGMCKEPYFFEVLKNGTIVSKIDLTTKPHYVFGRLPSCDIPMEHPSLSRHHAVVQNCTEKTDKHDIGWYLYDLDSTHGTWLNKNKIKPRVYHRLRVGYVVKFGGSTRLHILQGPTDDQEMESDLTVTEIKEQRERQKKEVEILRLADLTEIEEKNEALKKLAEDDGCSWGMGDDATEIDSNNPFSLEQPENEDLYIDDPKKSLRGYFEREGLDLPEYDIEDMGRGKYCCRVELPVYNVNGEPVIAEATLTGKKKEVVVACALEACRVLDKMGELRKANHESRKRKSKDWEQNDFYDSDEDTFLDRTGEIERKRQIRMKKFGKKKEKNAQTYDEIAYKDENEQNRWKYGYISQLETIEKEMKEIQVKLDDAKAKAEAVEAEDGLDALDLFMANIKSGAMDTKTRMSLKRRQFELKQEQAKLQKLANIAKPAIVPLLVSKSPVSESKPLPAFGKMKKSSGQSVKLTQQVKPDNPITNTDFEVEEEEEEEDEESVTENTIEKCTEKNSSIDAKESVAMETSNIMEQSESIERDNSAETRNKAQCNPTHKKPTVTSEKDGLDLKNVVEQIPKVKKQKFGSNAKGAALPTQDFIKHAKKRKKEEGSKEENVSFDPDYAVWIPPKDQSGDGRTSLNEKYGY